MSLERGGRIRQRSKRRQARLRRENRARVRAEVEQRDRFRCCLSNDLGGAGPCFGPLTPHHLWKEGQGGPFIAENLVTLCAQHNDWVEDHPLVGHAMGLVVRQGETLMMAWQRMFQREIVAAIPRSAALETRRA